MIKLDNYKNKFSEEQFETVVELLQLQESAFRLREQGLEDDLIKLKAEIRPLKSKIEKEKRRKADLAEKSKRAIERSEREKLFKIFSSFVKESIKAGKIK